MAKKSKKEECCPKFDPELWNEKSFTWKNKPFIKETIPTFFRIPIIPFAGKKFAKMLRMAHKANKLSRQKEDILMLFNDLAPFKTELYLSVTGKVPEGNNIDISGEFFAKVYDDPYCDISKAKKEINEYLKNEGKKAEQFYIHFSYCSKCSEKYGHSYTTYFAKVK